MNDVVDNEHRQAANNLKQLMAAYRKSEDLISIGAYQSGSNPTVDLAIQLHDRINVFLAQKVSEQPTFDEAVNGLLKLDKLRAILSAGPAKAETPADAIPGQSDSSQSIPSST